MIRCAFSAQNSLKMEITIHNGMSEKLWANFGFQMKVETDNATYVPGELGWRTGEWDNTATPTSGWDDNYLFMGKKSGYSGNTAHAIIWDPNETHIYSVIPKSSYTGVWIPASTEAGGTQTFTLYYMAHIPGADGEAYSVAKLWADAVENGTIDNYRSITGYVTLEDGTAVSGATVSFKGNGNTYKGMTDANGLFQIYAEKNVNYTMTVTGSELETKRESFWLGGDAAQLNITVNPGDGEDEPEFDTELPSDANATVTTLTEAPDYTYAEDSCNDANTGDLLIENDEISAVVDAKTGALKSVVPQNTKNDSITGAELVLQTAADDVKAVSHDGKGFAVQSISTEDHQLTLSANAEDASGVTAQITYAPVENSPLMKIKVALNNDSGSAYTGSLGYLFDPEDNGEQTYLNNNWIGGDDSNYGASVKSSLSTNYVYNGSLGRETEGSAHAILWADNSHVSFLPSKVLFQGGRMAVWYSVNLEAGGSQEIVFYHYAQPQGDATDPVNSTKLWAKVVNNDLNLDQIAQISGTAAAGNRIVAEAYTTAALADGTWRMFVPANATYSVYADNGSQQSDPVSVVAGGTADFSLAGYTGQTKVGRTFANPQLTYNDGSGIRDWWPTTQYWFMENSQVRINIQKERVGSWNSAPGAWDGTYSSNGKWGSVSGGTIVDAVNTLNNTDNLDWSTFLLFPDDRPEDSSDPDYFNRNYLGVTDEDEEHNMYMEWSWWFAVNKLHMNTITTGVDSLTASGSWEGGVDKDSTIESSVHYTLIDNSPLVKMELTLRNNGTEDFSGNLSFLLDPDLDAEADSYVPGLGWHYGQTKERITSGWTSNYIFDGLNGYSGNTAHAIIWPDDQQPSMIFSEGSWLSAWFHVDMAANGGEDHLTIYYLPHTPVSADAPYSVAEHWTEFIKNNGDAAQQGVITGRITDIEGTAMFGATVSLLQNGQVLQTTAANTDGNYTLYAAAGSYTLQVNATDYAPASKEIVLSGGEILTEAFVITRYLHCSMEFPEQITRGECFEFTVALKNSYGTALNDLELNFTEPDTIEILSQTPAVASVENGETVVVTLQALALSDGRRNLTVNVSQSGTLLTSLTKAFDVSGAGYYFGDSHTHSTYSDAGSRLSSNADYAYTNRLASWLWATEHNTTEQATEAAQITESYNGKFLHASGIEVTTGYKYKPVGDYGDPRGHALVYGYDGVPTIIVTEKDGDHDWQDSIDEITDAGALFFLAHPYDENYTFEDAEEWSGYTGVEVWNGSFRPDNAVNQKAFKLWDMKNILGEKHYYGSTGTDGHDKTVIAAVGLTGYMDTLTESELFEMMSTGQFYGTNGPAIRFTVSGAEMGSEVTLSQAGDVTIEYEAYTETGVLTCIRVLGYPITGNSEDYDAQAATLLELDLCDQNTNTYSGSLRFTVPQNYFFRMEVETTNQLNADGTPGGLDGFAYSNPIWVTIGDTDTRREISSITYNGVSVVPQQERFAVASLTVSKPFQSESLCFDAGNADVCAVYTKVTDDLYLADVTVTAGEASSVQTYLIRLTEDNGNDTPAPSPDPGPTPSHPGTVVSNPVSTTVPNPFADVSAGDWYYESIQSAWENGLINGVSETQFQPAQSLTVAQAIKLAAALHQRQMTGRVTLTNGDDIWYCTYVSYAVTNGILDESYLQYSAAQMNAPITRTEFAHIYYQSLAQLGYAELNTIADNAIPDVDMTAPYASEIYTLYRAGILTGNDEFGSFSPNSLITRAEAATILTRMYLPNQRVAFTLR